ncbi:MAG: glycosyltransferase family 2 protein [Caulobacterales bacterium]
MISPLVAICTPVYNGAKYLVETMDCVQAQDYPNLIHIVLDNASTDATPEIISRYSTARVPVITARNPELVPLADNWNFCLKMVPQDAKWFRILCADDLITPDATSKMVAVGESDPEIGLVGSGHRLGNEIQDLSWPKDKTVLDGNWAASAFFRGQFGFFAIQAIYRRDFLTDAPVHDRRLNVHDIKAALAVMLQSKVGLAHETLGYTRIHEGTVTSDVIDKKQLHLAEWFAVLQELGPKAMPEAEFKELYRRFRRHYFRKLAMWRLRPAAPGIVSDHLAQLNITRPDGTFLEYVDSLMDWPLTKVGLRPSWEAWPS